MEVWDQLLSTAVLGTGRQTLTLSPQSGPLGAMLERLQGQDPEHRLLGATAMVTLYRRAGQTASTDAETAPNACPTDTRPLCSACLCDVLALVLGDNDHQLLAEFLTLVQATNIRLPEEKYPAIIAAGVSTPDLRDSIRAVLGQRGYWLAARNPEWEYLCEIAITDTSAWANANSAQRVALLARIRTQDPAMARTLLEGNWANETPKDKAALLATFETGLRMEDEPFLESALDDKRKEVRQVAVDLLARLPESHLSRRNLARLLPLLTFTPAQPMRILPPTAARPAQLDIQLPEACDKAMQRDGIDAKVPSHVQVQQKLGEKAWWLQQMISLVPPNDWCERWESSPEELLKLVSQGEWSTVFHGAWEEAAIRHRDATWATLFFARGVTTRHSSANLYGLRAILSPSYCETSAIAILNRNIIDKESTPLGHLLEGCRRPWSRELSRAALAKIESGITHKTVHDNYWNEEGTMLTHCLDGFARYAPPADFGDIFEVLHSGYAACQDGRYHGHWEKVIEHTEARLTLRKEMHDAFQAR